MTYKNYKTILILLSFTKLIFPSEQPSDRVLAAIAALRSSVVGFITTQLPKELTDPERQSDIARGILREHQATKTLERNALTRKYKPMSPQTEEYLNKLQALPDSEEKQTKLNALEKEYLTPITSPLNETEQTTLKAAIPAMLGEKPTPKNLHEALKRYYPKSLAPNNELVLPYFAEQNPKK